MPYSPMQVSEMLEIAPSTLRRYAVTFAGYLSPQVKGKKRSYSDDDILILGKIKELARKLPFDQIGPRLPVVEELQPAAENSLSLIPTLAKELQRLDTDRQAVIKELAELRAAFAADHEKLDRFAAWAALPWWRRLFTPPPK